jgi:FixJ family two-component response regulator
MKETPSVVFVVDDEPLVCAALKRLIRSVGLDVQTFASAREFLHAESGYAWVPGAPIL